MGEFSINMSLKNVDNMRSMQTKVNEPVARNAAARKTIATNTKTLPFDRRNLCSVKNVYEGGEVSHVSGTVGRLDINGKTYRAVFSMNSNPNLPFDYSEVNCGDTPYNTSQVRNIPEDIGYYYDSPRYPTAIEFRGDPSLGIELGWDCVANFGDPLQVCGSGPAGDHCEIPNPDRDPYCNNITSNYNQECNENYRIIFVTDEIDGQTFYSESFNNGPMTCTDEDRGGGLFNEHNQLIAVSMQRGTSNRGSYLEASPLAPNRENIETVVLAVNGASHEPTPYPTFPPSLSPSGKPSGIPTSSPSSSAPSGSPTEAPSIHISVSNWVSLSVEEVAGIVLALIVVGLLVAACRRNPNAVGAALATVCAWASSGAKVGPGLPDNNSAQLDTTARIELPASNAQHTVQTVEQPAPDAESTDIENQLISSQRTSKPHLSAGDREKGRIYVTPSQERLNELNPPISIASTGQPLPTLNPRGFKPKPPLRQV